MTYDRSLPLTGLLFYGLLLFRLRIEALHELFKRNPGPLVFSLRKEKMVRCVLEHFVDVDVPDHVLKKLSHRDSMILCVKPQEARRRRIDLNF